MKIQNQTSLFDLINQSNQIEELLVESNGEVTEEIDLLLNLNEVTLKAKIDTYHSIIETLESKSEYWANKAEQFNKISKACIKTQERIKGFIKSTMLAQNLTELQGNNVRIKLSKTSGTLNIVDEKAIPNKFIQIKQIAEIKKSEIKDAIKNGETVNGCELVQGYSLRSYLK